MIYKQLQSFFVEKVGKIPERHDQDKDTDHTSRHDEQFWPQQMRQEGVPEEERVSGKCDRDDNEQDIWEIERVVMGLNSYRENHSQYDDPGGYPPDQFKTAFKLDDVHGGRR